MAENDGKNKKSNIFLKILMKGLKKKLIIIGLIFLFIASFSNLELWDDQDDGLISRKEE